MEMSFSAPPASSAPAHIIPVSPGFLQPLPLLYSPFCASLMRMLINGFGSGRSRVILYLDIQLKYVRSSTCGYDHIGTFWGLGCRYNVWEDIRPLTRGVTCYIAHLHLQSRDPFFLSFFLSFFLFFFLSFFFLSFWYSVSLCYNSRCLGTCSVN